MACWASYLDGLIAISSLPTRPKLDDKQEVERFSLENVIKVKILNRSSFLDTSADFRTSENIKRDKTDPLKSVNIGLLLRKYDHLVPDFEKTYDLFCHFIHPCSAIREIYSTTTEGSHGGRGLITISPRSLDSIQGWHEATLSRDQTYRESSENLTEDLQRLFLNCEQILFIPGLYRYLRITTIHRSSVCI